MGREKKKIVAIFSVLICVLLIGLSVTFIGVVKYRSEHRYLTYEELPQDAIVFQVKMSTGDCYTEIWEYDVSGKKYFSTYIQSDPYDRTTEKLVSNETEEDYITDNEVKYMYDAFLRVNRQAGYEELSNVITLDMSSSSFAGIRYRANGEVEYVYVAFGQGTRLVDRLKDPNAKVICDWLLEL